MYRLGNDSLCSLFVGFDEVSDSGVTEIGTHEEDVSRLVEFNVVLPEIGQQLRRFCHSSWDNVVFLVFLRILQGVSSSSQEAPARTYIIFGEMLG